MVRTGCPARRSCRSTRRSGDDQSRLRNLSLSEAKDAARAKPSTNAVKEAWRGVLTVPGAPQFIDVHGYLGYGAVGAWVLVLSLLALCSARWPRPLALLGIGVAVLRAARVDEQWQGSERWRRPLGQPNKSQ